MGERGRKFVLIGFFIVIGLLANTGIAKVMTSTVSYPSGSDTVSGYLALPGGQGPFPALVVIQEWWGLNDWIKENARKFAEQGYVALAVDLYRGRVTNSPDEAHELMRGLPEDRAIRDLKAAAAYLQSRSDVKKNKIGAIGWCMGGGYALQLAINQPDLAACVMNYGRIVTDSALIADIACPVLGIFGEEDRGIPVADVRQFEKACQRAGKTVNVHFYKAGHAFMNPNNKSGYRPAATKDAWSMITTFFARSLK